MQWGNYMELDATHYRKNSNQQYTRAKFLIDTIFKKDSSILDVGCGDGKITAEVADLVGNGKVLGIDASSNMIDFAKKTLSKTNLDFQCIDIELFETEERFDYILCLSCLLWVRKPKQALEKMINLLKPGGKLLILTYLKDSSYVEILEETLKSFPQYQKKSAANTMLSEQEHLQILNSFNLYIEMFKVQEDTATYMTNKDLKDYLKGWLVSYVPLPINLQENFLHEAILKSSKFIDQKNSKHTKLPFKSLYIKAIKPLK